MTKSASLKVALPIAASLLFVAFAAPALAFGILDLDSNHDGAIASLEAQHALEGQFDKMDANRDGQLTKAEFTDARLAELSRLDGNGDGQITRAELRDTFKGLRR